VMAPSMPTSPRYTTPSRSNTTVPLAVTMLIPRFASRTGR
jgi:hypothetical protein